MLLDIALANPHWTLLIGYAAYYAALCTASPFGRHRRCKGTGRKGNSRRRDCRRCDGTGRRVRLGRRAYTYITREYREGTR